MRMKAGKLTCLRNGFKYAKLDASTFSLDQLFVVLTFFFYKTQQEAMLTQGYMWCFLTV